MKRGSAYVDTNPNPNLKPYGVSERQPMSGQGIQQNNYGGGPGDASERQLMSGQGMQQNNYGGGGGNAFAKSDEQSQWDRDAQQVSTASVSSGPIRERIISKNKGAPRFETGISGLSSFDFM